MSYQVKIIDAHAETHDVRHFIVEKPADYRFRPGQSTTFSLPANKFQGQKRPFSFVSVNAWEHLDFLIKIYEENDGMTKDLMNYGADDEVVIEEPFGSISYQGPGVFIAGGMGVTPFIAIFRQLKKDYRVSSNQVLFAAKRKEDIILHDEIKHIFGDRVRFVLSREEKEGYDCGRIDQDYLRKHIINLNQYFYVCGPPAMVHDITRALDVLGADSEKVITEDNSK